MSPVVACCRKRPKMSQLEKCPECLKQCDPEVEWHEYRVRGKGDRPGPTPFMCFRCYHASGSTHRSQARPGPSGKIWETDEDFGGYWANNARAYEEEG